MNTNNEAISTTRQILIAARMVLTTMVICCGVYTLLILGIGQIMVPYTANGSLLSNEQGEIIGSESIAQAFTRPEYIWPRPSAPDYDASATGGSNWSPTNPALRERAVKILGRMRVEEGNPLPADLVTASGSGMDPHITLKAAQYQMARVAEARGIPVSSVQSVLERHAEKKGGFLTNEPLVNVLLVNIALDKLEK
ncbi:K(+)-transporting ATPase subunit C [Desulfotignum balticum]|uniref:K(+)-transporting ATPase subunit C n=1 Tax=Desulfotignum balticum TaxID=115781 RepID=UPI0004625B7B|nr:K(+)-transporting ATPase subunit C [Desulfotignum balticum]